MYDISAAVILPEVRSQVRPPEHPTPRATLQTPRHGGPIVAAVRQTRQYDRHGLSPLYCGLYERTGTKKQNI